MKSSTWGQAFIDNAESVAAGSYCTVNYRFKAAHSIDDRGVIKIVFRHAADFGTPQFSEPDKKNYCSVATSGNCEITPRWDPRGHPRPWRKTLFLHVHNGYLDAGETVKVVFGDRENGSPGWRMQTFTEDTFEFKTFVDPIAALMFKELPSSPTLRIIPGEPLRAICLAPSTISAGKQFCYYLKLEDKWGNPVREPREFCHPGFADSGFYTITASDDNTGLEAESNPIKAGKSTAECNHYWADFHGQSEETIGSNSIEDYFRFARDYAMLDIAGHQGNDFQITDDFWDKIKRVSEDYNEPGRFVVFPGYEWSGNTPLGGDRNVYFGSEGDIHRSSRCLLPGSRSRYTDAPTAADLFELLNHQEGAAPFVFAHAGGRYADMDMHDEGLEIAAEVHSAWGTFEWLIDDAFERGYRVGICANSDDHKGRPGASYPGAGLFGCYGGLTCVLSPSLDREAVLEAVRSRHFYATTGNRPLITLEMTVKGQAAATMGDLLHCSRNDIVILRALLKSKLPIESVELKNGKDTLKTFRTYEPSELGRRLKIIWSGAERRGRGRMADWSGRLKVEGNSIRNATPVNFWNPECPLKMTGDDGLEWSSFTSGNEAGVVVELEKKGCGTVSIETAQGNAVYDVSSTGYEAKEYELGGLEKKISIYGIPDAFSEKEREVSIKYELDMKAMKNNTAPVFLHMRQLDGHRAWTSPVYITSEETKRDGVSSRRIRGRCGIALKKKRKNLWTRKREC